MCLVCEQNCCNLKLLILSIHTYMLDSHILANSQTHHCMVWIKAVSHYSYICMRCEGNLKGHLKVLCTWVKLVNFMSKMKFKKWVIHLLFLILFYNIQKCCLKYLKCHGYSVETLHDLNSDPSIRRLMPSLAGQWGWLLSRTMYRDPIHHYLFDRQCPVHYIN